MHRSHDELSSLPRALADRLAAEDRVTPLTPQVDDAVRRAAVAHFAARGTTTERNTARPSQAITRRRWVVPAAAAAAAALFALLVVRPLDYFGTDAALTANDVDGSGRIDILDAFALARARAADPARVTQGQVDALAEQIVSLTSGASLR